MHQAAEFLAGDIEKISGYKPAMVKTAGDDKVNIRLVTLGHGQIPAAINAARHAGTVGELPDRHRRPQRLAGRARTRAAPRSPPTHCRSGWASIRSTSGPATGPSITIRWCSSAPASRRRPPTFRYRGFFHDDEDLLPRPFDANGNPLQTGDVPLDWYKRFFETALRLRMNMVAPYTRVHRRYEVQKLASDWGLYYTSHHYDILVSNPFGLTRFNLAAERGVKPDYELVHQPRRHAQVLARRRDGEQGPRRDLARGHARHRGPSLHFPRREPPTIRRPPPSAK